jgi:hypothetical protein
LAEFGLGIFHDQKNFFALSVAVAYTLLAFTPLYLFKLAVRKPKGNLHFAVIAVVELVVVLLFCGMLFPKL